MTSNSVAETSQQNTTPIPPTTEWQTQQPPQAAFIIGNLTSRHVSLTPKRPTIVPLNGLLAFSAPYNVNIGSLWQTAIVQPQNQAQLDSMIQQRNQHFYFPDVSVLQNYIKAGQQPMPLFAKEGNNFEFLLSNQS